MDNDLNASTLNDLSSNREEELVESIECSSKASSQGELELIEIYAQKLLKLQRSLNKKFPDAFSREQLVQTNELNNPPPPSKLKFKQLHEFKKDAVFKKLLKTIDLMNIEINKRDRIIASKEKQYQDLEVNLDKYIQQANESTYYEFELNKAKQEIKNEQVEKETLVKKLELLEKQLADAVKSNEETVSDYKEIASPYNNVQQSAQQATNNEFNKVRVEKLEQENQELNFINDMLSNELNKFKRQLELLERKNVLESEINEKFNNLLEQKLALEQENQELLSQLDLLESKLKDCEIMVEQEITNAGKSYQEELQEAKKRLNELEILSKQRDEILEQYEIEIKAANSLTEKYNEERLSLIKALNTIQEEKAVVVQQSAKQIASYESKLESLQLDYETLNEKCTSLTKLSFEQQKQMQKMFLELDEKKDLNEKQAIKKIDEMKRVKQMLNLANEKIKYLQQKHSVDLENMRKRYSKENEQLKFSNESNTMRNGELSRANLEMRKKIQQLEADLKEANEKCFIHKQSADTFNKQKKDQKEESDKLVANLRKEIENLEHMRDEYLKKSQQQQDSIEKMLKQLNGFQSELDVLVNRNSLLNDKLKKANSTSETYRRKYYDLKDFLRKEVSKIKLNEEKENKSYQENIQINQQLQKEHQSERLFEANKRIKNLIRELRLDDILNDRNDGVGYSQKSSCSTVSTEINDNDVEIEWCDLKICKN